MKTHKRFGEHLGRDWLIFIEAKSVSNKYFTGK
jgi:hypothetical protein